MGALRSRHNVPLEDSIRDVRKQIDNAKFLSLKYVMSFGTNNPEQFAHYYKVMSDASAYAEEKGVKLVMKPHGGISGSAEEILHVIKEVNHRNFSIWYDAGNIIHYTGKDPVAEIEPIARYITGFCAKDCGELRGDVMIQFGAGKVDFAGVFRKLKARRIQRPGHGRMLQGGRDAGRDHGERASQPRIPGKGSGLGLTPRPCLS